MIDSVKGCSEIEENEDTEVARVRGEEVVVGDFEEGCFGAVM